MVPDMGAPYDLDMKFHVHWTDESGDKVEMGPFSLDNAIAFAEDQTQRGGFLYITDDNGKRLTLKAASRLKAATHA